MFNIHKINLLSNTLPIIKQVVFYRMNHVLVKQPICPFSSY